MKKNKLTITEKLILAAFELESTGNRIFSAEDLVVSAWSKFPDSFGLAGYRGKDGEVLYPDSNRVYAEIMGRKPIRTNGFLIKVGMKMYQLTESGVENARLLLNKLDSQDYVKGKLPREIVREIKRLFKAKVVEKFLAGKELSFYDACGYWNISPRSSAIELEGRFSNIDSILKKVKEISQGKGILVEHSEDYIREEDLDMLIEIHKVLKDKFVNDLNIIRKRIDERV